MLNWTLVEVPSLVTLDDSGVSCAVAGPALGSIIPIELPRCYANHMFPLESEVSHCTKGAEFSRVISLIFDF